MKHFIITTAIFCLFSLPALAEEGFVSLIPPTGTTWTENEKPLEGWIKHGGEAIFVVEDDTIVGIRGPSYSTFLCTEKFYRNFIFKFDVKFDILANSGLQFRSNTQSKSDQEMVYGYQCEIDEDKDTCLIFDESRRGWLTPPNENTVALIDDVYKKGDWNEITIQCVGPSIKTWLNGENIVNITDDETAEGFFGLQMHCGDQGQVRWRNIRVKELPEEE